MVKTFNHQQSLLFLGTPTSLKELIERCRRKAGKRLQGLSLIEAWEMVHGPH